MSEELKNQEPVAAEAQEPLIPPQILLFVALAGFIVAFIVLFTQPEFGVVGYGGLAFGVLALVAWIFMAPDQARSFFGGRNVRFGGFTIVVSLIVILALVGIYTAVRTLELRYDLTERDTFSLTEEAREVITTLGADPTTPRVNIVAFYSANRAAGRDQDTLLFEDYANTSGGKISYEFVDPDRNPQIAERYSVTRDGQIVVVALDEAGEPLLDNAETVDFFAQDQLTNAILSVSASGDFRAYFMNVQDGLAFDATNPEAPSISNLAETFRESFNWDVQSVSFLDLLSPESEIALNDEAADGEVMIIAGGSQALTDEEFQIVADYVSAGGDLVLFAGNSLNEDGTSLATAENMSNFLFENFGFRLNNDVVIDPVQAFQSALLPIATDLALDSYITGEALPPGAQNAIIFEVPHSIEVAETTPAGVALTVLARSSENAYAKTDVAALMAGENVERADGDVAGPFNLAVQAENTTTGARLVVFSSVSPAQNDYAQFQNLSNFNVAFNSLVWATGYQDFFSATNIVSQPAEQDAPVFASQQQLRNINFATMVLLPFGVLALGIVVWWNNRERGARAK